MTIDDYAQDILEWIGANFYEQPRLEDLASKLGYSIRMIQLHFKKTHGMTIGDYIHNRRLYRACVMLRMTELSVGEIALQLHFGNHHNFCRAFKKKLHCTPRAFRMLPINCLPSLALPQINYDKDITHSIVTLKNKVLLGTDFQYEDKFTDPNSTGGVVRLRRLQAWFQDNHSTLTIASDIERNKKPSNSRAEMITVSAIVGNIVDTVPSINIPENTTFYILDGLYLCCPFHGFFSEYAAHNKDIYMHLLHKLKLNRRVGRDVEFFYFTPHIFDESPKVFCEHYIPIVDDRVPL
ncbi:hypothetical protein BSQ40_25875 [Serratia fonticola]|nr:hypothetical protein BSQ40_25875 [Serratia fonticola]